MPAVSSIIAGGSAILGAGASIISGNKAAKAQKQAAEMSDATQRYMYDTTREDMAPYREIGTGALGKLADMYGIPRSVNSPASTSNNGLAPAQTTTTWGRQISLPGGGTVNIPGTSGTVQPQQQMTPGYDGFQESPGYKFRLGEGLKAIERSAASRGLLGSGGTLKALQRYGEGLASSEYENYANRLSALAGIGQTSTAQTAAFGQQTANNISQNQLAAGNARASAYANTGAAINNGVSNALFGYLRYGQGGGGGFGPGFLDN